VLVPCALGGLFDDEVVTRLRCRAIAGAANNQLADDHIAGLLQDRGILWAPDFVANAGGIINIAEEAGGYDPAAARRRVRGIGDTLGMIFQRSDETGETPLAAAMELAGLRLDGTAPHRGSDGPRASGPGRSTPAGSRPSA
jgi:leucine dehydrogenase